MTNEDRPPAAGLDPIVLAHKVPSESQRQSAFALKLVLVLILLAASAFRFIGLNSNPNSIGATPPGLEHDEVAHWLINQDILAGNHAIYFTEAYGHEALYHYIQAGIGALVGDHALGLRLPSAYFGLLLVAISYSLGRRMFGMRVGLWSAAFLAVLFWPVFYSRLALRAISLPVLSGLAAYWWWRAFAGSQGSGGERERGRRGARGCWHLAVSFSPPPHLRTPAPLLFLSGLFAGLCLHTYMAGRAVPIFFALYTLYLGLFHRTMFRRHARDIALFWLALILVALPLVLFLTTNPNAEIRIAEVDAPLRALRDGDMQPVLENALKIAGMFGFSGDPLWRQNIAGQPVFDPMMAVLFYAGVAFSLWRWRDKRHAFILLWLASSVIPSLVTIDAPSSIRIINLLPVLLFFPLILIHKPPHLFTIWDKLSPELTTRVVTWVLAGLLLLSGWNTFVGLWRVWPANDEVRFVWQAALTGAAAYLDRSDDAGPVAVGGWTPETMDPPTMALTLRREDLSLRYFDPGRGVILPVAPDGQSIRIVTPSILPLAPALAAAIAPQEQVLGDFIRYELVPGLDITPEHPGTGYFGNQLRFLGFNTTGPCVVGDSCDLLTYWEVTAPADGPRRIFLHAVEGGRIVSQDDGLAAPAVHWQAGDIVVQLLTLPETTDDLRLGVYDPDSDIRLKTSDGEVYVTLDIP